jgi:Domain of unknown function (DUF1992)
MPQPPNPKRGVQRKDADGGVQVGANWESLIERQIREAMEQGKFDDLPLHGQPLPNHDNPWAGDWSLAFQMLKNASVAPPWIEADKEVRALLVERDAILSRAAAGQAPTNIRKRRDRAVLKDLVTRLNAAIAKVNAEAPTLSQHRRALVLADELARYEDACERQG